MRVWLRTFGCRANQYDTEAVRAMLEGAGVEIVASAAEADAAVFNSCAVTVEAEAELRSSVRRAARERPGLRSVVMGCATTRPDGGIEQLPGVVRAVAGADLAAVAESLGVPAAAPGSAPNGFESGTGRVPWEQSSARALLRIQDGCDEHCTFCWTTLARGASRSRSADELVAEARALGEHHPEIVLTGIHIGGYGHDVGTSLGALLERLVAEVPNARFRLSSIEATEVDERLAELIAGAPGRVAPHLHAPLQSGSDAVLKRMGRHWYGAASYATAIERLAARAPLLGLGADVIAGFPGETDADHRATLALVERLPFTYLHVFPYSRRTGTPADRLSGHLRPEVIRDRAAELRALGERRAEAHRARRVGSEADVVVVGAPGAPAVTSAGGGGGREGITEDYLTVFVRDPAVPRRSRIRALLARDEGRRELAAIPTTSAGM